MSFSVTDNELYPFFHRSHLQLANYNPFHVFQFKLSLSLSVALSLSVLFLCLSDRQFFYSHWKVRTVKKVKIENQANISLRPATGT